MATDHTSGEDPNETSRNEGANGTSGKTDGKNSVDDPSDEESTQGAEQTTETDDVGLIPNPTPVEFQKIVESYEDLPGEPNAAYPPVDAQPTPGVDEADGGIRLTVGKNFKEHYRGDKRSLLSSLTGNKYRSNADIQSFLDDLSGLIDSGDLKYVGESTLQEGGELGKIYRGRDHTLVTHQDGSYWTLLEDVDSGLNGRISYFMKPLE